MDDAPPPGITPRNITNNDPSSNTQYPVAPYISFSDGSQSKMTLGNACYVVFRNKRRRGLISIGSGCSMHIPIGWDIISKMVFFNDGVDFPRSLFDIRNAVTITYSNSSVPTNATNGGITE